MTTTYLREVVNVAAELRGENRIKTFRKIARKLASQISNHKGVVGIAFLGGLSRGFADKFSDIDIVVLLAARKQPLRKQLYDLSSAMQKRFNTDIDLEVHFLEDFRKQKWDEIDRWEFSKAKIVYDPEGVVKEVLDGKLKLPRSFWKERVVECAEYLKWYCCPPRVDVGTVAESWLERGDLSSAHHCLNYAVDMIVSIVFALNKQHSPAPKWQLFYSYRLEWQPRNYRKLITDAMKIKSFSIKDFNRRLIAIRKIWRGVVPKIEDETGLTMDQLSKYYVENILGIRI